MTQARIKGSTTKHIAAAVMSLAIAGGIITGIGGMAGVDAAGLHRSHRGQIACASLHLGGEKRDAALTDLVTGGTITAAQQQAIENKLAEFKTDPAQACTGMELIRDKTTGAAVLDLLGMDRIEVRQAWIDGQSLAEVAESQGVSREELIATITSSIDERLSVAVENGKITGEQKSAILAGATERIETGIDAHIGDGLDRLQERKDARDNATATPVSVISPVLI